MKNEAYTKSEARDMLLSIYERLPLTERTLLKRLGKYSFELRNDTGDGCLYRVIVDGKELGAVKYYRGRKLVVYELVEAA